MGKTKIKGYMTKDGFVPEAPKPRSAKQAHASKLAGEALHCTHEEWVRAGKPGVWTDYVASHRQGTKINQNAKSVVCKQSGATLSFSTSGSQIV